MYIYYCWITALLPSYQDGIVAGLARAGYMVGPAAKDGKVTIVKDNCPSALISLSLYKEGGDPITIEKIYDDVALVLSEIKAYYYSIVISLSYEATWAGPNFNLPQKGAGPPVPSTLIAKKRNMN